MNNLQGQVQVSLSNFIGVSVYRNSEIKSLIRDKNIDLIQIPFNMLDSSKDINKGVISSTYNFYCINR